MKQVIAKFERSIDNGDALLSVLAMTTSDGNWLPADHPYIKEEIGYHQKVFVQSFDRLYPVASENKNALYIYTVVRSIRRELPYKYSVSQVQIPRAVFPVIICSDNLWTPHSTVNQKVITEAAANHKTGAIEPVYFRQGPHLLGPFVMASGGGFRPLSGDQVPYHEVSPQSNRIVIKGAEYIDRTVLPTDGNAKYFCFSPGRVLDWYNQNAEVASRIPVSSEELLSVTSAESSPVAQSLARELEGYIETINLPQTVLQEIFRSPRVRPGVLEEIVKNSADRFNDETRGIQQRKEELAKELSEVSSELDLKQKLVQSCLLELAGVERKRKELLNDIDELNKVRQEQQLQEAEEITHSLIQLRKERNNLLQEVKSFTSIIEEMNREFDLEEGNGFTDFTRLTITSEKPRSEKQRDLRNAILNFAEDALSKELMTGTGNTGDEAYELIRALETSRCILSPRTFTGRLLAGATSNTDFFHCLTACDWLTYADFDRAILRQVISTALATPGRFVFLQLLDYNKSAPSCYLQPVLQHLRGDTDTLPGGLRWPQNLWLVLVPATVGIAGPGLPVEAALLRDVVRVCHLEHQGADAGAGFVEEHCFNPDMFPLSIPYAVAENGLSHYCNE